MSVEASSTSSIGAAWPPISASNDRMRGFYPEAVVSEAGLEDLVTEFADAQKATEDHPTATRLSMRAVVQDELIPILGEAVSLEGALPIAGTPGRHIVYAAWNDVNRRPAQSDLLGHHNLITQVQLRPQSTDDPYAELLAKGFEPRVIDGNMSDAQRHSYQERFLGLYGKFDFDADDVTELLTNPNNTIVYIEKDGNIVSTALAERGTIPVLGQPNGGLTISEITEAVTDPAARGNGLYRALSGFLVRCVVERHHSGKAPLDTLYGESNLSSPGVIVAAHRNGRRFSVDDAARLGVQNHPDFGILQQNVAVNDGAETRPFNDFALTYIDLSSR